MNCLEKLARCWHGFSWREREGDGVGGGGGDCDYLESKTLHT